jgi:hypothetical protein
MFLLPVPGGFANDTIARFAAGGIIFAKTDHIGMLERKPLILFIVGMI